MPERSMRPLPATPAPPRLASLDAYRGFVMLLMASEAMKIPKVLEKFPSPETPITMTFRKGHFRSGHDLKDFAAKLGIELQQGDVEQ